MMDFGSERPHRRPNLTPMIDVVFLLLVFFMLASRFGADTVLPLSLASQGASYSGPPRLVDIRPDGIALNGIAVAPEDLGARVLALTTKADDTVVLRPRDAADLQRVIAVMEVLRAAGLTRLVMVD